MSEWISVEDRLPEKNGIECSEYVLAWHQTDEAAFIGYYVFNKGDYFYEEGWHDVTGFSLDKVTHWQPLPAPPEANHD